VSNTQPPDIYVHVIGTGLIGASLALALQRVGYTVSGEDIDPHSREIARKIGIADQDKVRQPDVIVVSVPPSHAAKVLSSSSMTFPEATITDVTSVKGSILSQAVKFGADTRRLVSAHPMAGREVSGPRGARDDLFQDRVWVITPFADTEAHRINVITSLIESIGSTWVEMDMDRHDRVAALVSHAPQIMSSILAGELVDRSASDLSISGVALGEMTRIAASDSQLWQEILIANSPEVVNVIDSIIANLTNFREAIADHDAESISQFMVRGNAGRMQVPGKHGGNQSSFTAVNVMISDEPGALAQLFTAAGELGVNLEDVRIEHVMGRPSGIVQLFVRESELDMLESGLEFRGFDTRGRG
jgi:prephenate dehydrogenase